MFKSTALSFALSVTKLLKSVNSSSTGNIPHKWELSSVIPIPSKSSVNTDNPSNNRPIISKLQERHIYNVVLKHLTERETLAGAQWGVYSRKICYGSFLNIPWQSGSDVSLVFFDLHKPFDTIPHLATPFASQVIVVWINTFLQWITCYLHDREQYIVDGASSEILGVATTRIGLGTTILFLIYINC